EELFARISKPGETDSYLFSGDDASVVYIDTRVGASSDLKIKLTDHEGTLLLEEPFGDQGPITLDGSGDFRIDVSGVDDATTYYELVVWNVPNDPPLTIQFDSPVSSAITVPTEIKHYEIDAQSGTDIFFDELFDAGTEIRYSLVSPSGQILFDELNDGQVVEIVEGGIHTVVVDGLGESAGSFSFQFGEDEAPPPITEFANLAISSLELPRRVIGSPATVEVQWTIRNDGNVVIPAGTELSHHFHLSSDARLGSLQEDPRFGVVARTLDAPLDPGQSITLNAELQTPTGIDADLFVLVHVDGENTIFENEDELLDNVLARPVTISPQARQLVGDPVIEIQPESGTEFLAGSAITLSGTATSAPGAVNAVFLLDLSGSTRLVTGLDANFDGVIDEHDDLNGDGRTGDLLDREIGLTMETVRRLSDSATDVRVAVAAWTASNIAFPSGGEMLDVGSPRFNQIFVNPSDPQAMADLQTAVQSLSHRQQGLATHSGASQFRDFVIGPGNNYDQSLETLLEVLEIAPESDQTQVYYFTDGLYFPNEDLPALTETISEIGARGIQFRAIQAIGPSQVQSVCSGDSIPDWCISVESGNGFVEAVRQISEGINAQPGSVGDVVLGDNADGLDDLIMPPVSVAGVTVNDAAVESFDIAGNFFTEVEILEGDNTFVVRAIDSLGNQTAEEITLVGTNGTSRANVQEVTALTSIEFESATLNRESHVLQTNARIVNRSNGRLRGPIQVVLNRIEPPSITLMSDHELDAFGRPVVTLSEQAIGDGLSSFASTAPFDLMFANAESQRFEIDYSILAIGNQAPVIESTPVTAAAAGLVYEYDAFASDLDGDELTFASIQGPEGFSVDSVTGQVRWVPTVDQIGNHTIEVEARDGWG
ncbi:MAG: Ig-like domain-containing protein, partial [Planctomycetota bacterium]